MSVLVAEDGWDLAVLLDEGGRYVGVLDVPAGIKVLRGLPFLRHDKAANDRAGLVADRMPNLGDERVFERRLATRTNRGRPVVVYKETPSL